MHPVNVDPPTQPIILRPGDTCRVAGLYTLYTEQEAPVLAEDGRPIQCTLPLDHTAPATPAKRQYWRLADAAHHGRPAAS